MLRGHEVDVVEIPRQLTVARLVDLPFRILRPQFWKLWVPFTALYVLVGAPMQIASASGWLSGVDETGAPSFTPALVAISLWPLIFVGNALIYVGLFGAVLDMVEGRPIRVGAALKGVLELRKVALTTFLVFGTFFGAACCVFPGILFMTYLGLAMPVVYVERLGFGAALQRALDLVKGGRLGEWWGPVVARSGAVVVVTLLMQYALGTLVALPQSIYGFKSAFEAAATGTMAQNTWTLIPGWVTVLSVLGQGAVYCLVSLYDATGTILVYRDARERLEGAGLEAAVRNAQA